MSDRNGTTTSRSCHRNSDTVLAMSVELTLLVNVMLRHGIKSS